MKVHVFFESTVCLCLLHSLGMPWCSGCRAQWVLLGCPSCSLRCFRSKWCSSFPCNLECVRSPSSPIIHHRDIHVAVLQIEEILRGVGWSWGYYFDQLHTDGVVDGRGLCIFLRGVVGKPRGIRDESTKGVYLNHSSCLCGFGSLMINDGVLGYPICRHTDIYVNPIRFVWVSQAGCPLS